MSDITVNLVVDPSPITVAFQSTGPQGPPAVPTVTTNATALNTPCKISTTQGAWVIASVKLAPPTPGATSKVELLIDSANPPTTVRATVALQLGVNSIPNVTQVLMGWVPANQYYKLSTTGSGITVVGNVQELLV